MANMESERQCSKGGCEVATTGSCAEGHNPVRSCPFFGKIGTDVIDDYDDGGSGTIDGVASEKLVDLPSGELLSPAEVDKFLRRQGAIFITIVGERDSGKTTLVCAIHARFLNGPFANHLFAGSKTLVGLEKRSHYSRADSGRTHADTPRTSISEGLRFFHLAVVSRSDSAQRSNLMLSDRAGESYAEARSNSEAVPELVEVVKADCLVLLLDGARVADPVLRAGAMQVVRQTLRAFVDGNALPSTARVQVVTTKLDLLVTRPDWNAIKLIISRFRDRLHLDFAPHVASLSFWEVSARDPTGTLPPAYGIEHLLTDWLTPHTVPIRHTQAKAAPTTTEFDKLLWRTPMEEFPL
jgi:hypothetical protein